MLRGVQDNANAGEAIGIHESALHVDAGEALSCQNLSRRPVH